MRLDKSIQTIVFIIWYRVPLEGGIYVHIVPISAQNIMEISITLSEPDLTFEILLIVTGKL